MSRLHPTPEFLSEYAYGLLNYGLSLAVSCHLHWCEECSLAVAERDLAAGRLLEQFPPLPLREGSLQRTLDRARAPASSALPEDRPQGHLPKFLKMFSLPPLLEQAQIERRFWLSTNLWMAPVQKHSDPKNSRLFLLWGGPSAYIPRHWHAKNEFVTILHGSYVDDGVAYRRGDFIHYGAVDAHAPEIPPDTDCLCLVSADGSMRMATLTGQIMQMMLGRSF